VVCERGAAKGLRVFPTLLVNQAGGASYAEDTRTSDWWLEHPHLKIDAAAARLGAPLPAGFIGGCMDFSHAEVRTERLALVQETVAKYPVDGFELQLNYSPHYFHPAEAAEGCAAMTEWVGRCHAAVKASGPAASGQGERLLIVRVPASLEGCLARGLDLVAWLRLGIVDVLVSQVGSRRRHLTTITIVITGQSGCERRPTAGPSSTTRPGVAMLPSWPRPRP
jgi:hypothetical protein